MKIKLQAENVLEWLAMKFNLAPRPLIDTQVSFSAARAIMVAAELGIFEAIGTQTKTALKSLIFARSTRGAPIICWIALSASAICNGAVPNIH